MKTSPWREDGLVRHIRMHRAHEERHLMDLSVAERYQIAFEQGDVSKGRLISGENMLRHAFHIQIHSLPEALVGQRSEVVLHAPEGITNIHTYISLCIIM